MGHPTGFWVWFHVLIAVLLVVDLRVFQRKSHVVKFREACLESGFWVAIALLFNLWVYESMGGTKALEFFTGYLIEKSLSVDNLFIFLMIFTWFRTQKLFYHKILFWGIIGALVFRISLILMGVTLIEHFKWMFYVFGALLPISGIKMILDQNKKQDPSKGLLYRLLAQVFPVAKKGGEEGQFFVSQRGRWKVTSLFLTLVMIECTDIVMALDSIPAVFAITTDAFIVYTSNVFAVLGLRALFFVLASTLAKLRHLKTGLAAILVFVGSKMLLTHVFAISVQQSLAVIFVILLVAVLASIRDARKKK